MNTTPHLDAILVAAEELEPPPKVLLRLLQVVGIPNHSRNQVVDVISSEPILASRVLKIANSSFFRGDGKISDLSQAVGRLGEATLTTMATTCAARMLDQESVPGYGYEDSGLMEHCQATAVASRLLARKIGGIPEGVAYTSGLLCDVGVLVLGYFVASHEQELVQAEDAFDLREKALFGIDHAELGGILADRWGLPEASCAAIRHHHRPSDAPEIHRNLVCLVHIADMLAKMTDRSTTIDGMSYDIDEAWPEHVPLQDHDFQGLLLTLCEEMRSVREMMLLNKAA